MHSIYQKLRRSRRSSSKWGFPNQSELRGTWPVREEVIPLHGIRVAAGSQGSRKRPSSPRADLPLRTIDGGVEVIVPVVEMHAMVVFE